MLIQSQVGQPSVASMTPGTTPSLRSGQHGDLIVSECHGRFYEQAYRGNLFRTGTTAVVAGASTHGTATGGSGTLATAAGATPMLGVWNPANSPVNLVILQATLHAFINTINTPVPFGSLTWYASNGNAAITTGLIPWNSKTLTQVGSMAKGFAGATALTGLSAVFSAVEAADFATGGSVTYGTIGNTAVHSPLIMTQNFDGQLIVPPGAVLALYNTAATTSFSFTGRLLWEEVAI